MSSLGAGPLPNGYTATREILHRVATHVLSRRRAGVTGKIGLRASPGGIATPAFGPEPEVVRLAGLTLVREVGGETSRLPLTGATLRQLANFVEADIDAEFSAGGDTPDRGDVDEALFPDANSAVVLARWYDFGWQALDRFLADLGPDGDGSTVQLWPEHFDAGTSVQAGRGGRANIGASPGDGFSPAPYLYVGPWTDARPGPPGYWNAPFGATLAWPELAEVEHAEDRALAFLREGVGRLAQPR